MIRNPLTDIRIWMVIAMFAVCMLTAAPTWAQDAGTAANTVPTEIEQPGSPGLSFFSLLARGGWLMLPLAALSILVVTLAIERAITLRRERIMPSRLVRDLSKLADLPGGFDPRGAFRLCQTYPSSAARILRSMLLKVGRPQGEIEMAVGESVQRETNRLQSPVSWLSLAAAVAPLIGLLGTVWGITQAFYEFTLSSKDVNPGSALAEGIYTALVTTLAGLAIAIPAAVLAHFFENRIVNQLNEVDEMIANLLPQVERYEGRVRFQQPADKSDRSAPATWSEVPSSGSSESPAAR